GFNIVVAGEDVKMLPPELATPAQLIVVTEADLTESVSGDDLQPGADTISGGEGDDIILGDYGVITQSDGTIRILDTGNVIQIETVRPEDGGNDTIQGDAADDVILGGAGGDEIDAGEGDNIVIGDSGKLVYSEGVLSTVETTAHDTGGNDTISTGSGNDLIFGGFGTDVITAAGGENLILGDNGIASFLTDGDGLSLDLLETTAPALGGDDVISSGNEDDIIFAGAGND